VRACAGFPSIVERVEENTQRKTKQGGVLMGEDDLKEKARERKRAMANCSRAILESIRSYGLTATLDLLVRLSNCDTVVREVLPYFPTIAGTAMLEVWTLRTESKTDE